MKLRKNPTARVAVLLAVVAFAVTGCSSPAPAATETTTAGDAVVITDAWVKSAESGMSAAFGTLTNESSADVTVTAAETAASAMVELHETVENDAGEMIMREIEGGFVIPAGGSLDLTPRGNHLMMMDLTAPLVAGDDIAFTVAFSDGSTYEFTAPVKDYSGANENYDGGMDMDD